jgi:hypothetical protein
MCIGAGGTQGMIHDPPRWRREKERESASLLPVCQSVVCEAPKIVNHQGHGILATAPLASPLAVACRRLGAVPCTQVGIVYTVPD